MGLPGAGSDELPPIPLYDETRREVEEEEDLFAPSRLARGNGRRNKDRSCQGVHMEERSPVSWAEQGRNKCNLADTGKVRLRA